MAGMANRRFGALSPAALVSSGGGPPEGNPYLMCDEPRTFLESRYADVALAFSNA